MWKKTLCGFFGAGLLLVAVLPVFSGDTLKIRASHDYTSRPITLEDPFEALTVNGDIDVVFQQAEKVSAGVYGAENLVRLVRVNVKDGTLYIGFDQPVIIRGRRDLQVRVSGPDLNKITVSGKGEVKVRGGLITDDLDIQAADQGEVSLSQVEADNIRIQATGRAEVSVERILKAQSVIAYADDRAEVDLSGVADKAELENRGAEDIDAEDLRADFVKAASYGRGDITCRPLRELDAAAYGWGKVEYEGFPEVLNKTGKSRRIIRED